VSTKDKSTIGSPNGIALQKSTLNASFSKVTVSPKSGSSSRIQHVLKNSTEKGNIIQHLPSLLVIILIVKCFAIVTNLGDDSTPSSISSPDMQESSAVKPEGMIPFELEFQTSFLISFNINRKPSKQASTRFLVVAPMQGISAFFAFEASTAYPR
jgi:hypothetical protein